MYELREFIMNIPYGSPYRIYPPIQSRSSCGCSACFMAKLTERDYQKDNDDSRRARLLMNNWYELDAIIKDKCNDQF